MTEFSIAHVWHQQCWCNIFQARQYQIWGLLIIVLAPKPELSQYGWVTFSKVVWVVCAKDNLVSCSNCWQTDGYWGQTSCTSSPSCFPSLDCSINRWRRTTGNKCGSLYLALAKRPLQEREMIATLFNRFILKTIETVCFVVDKRISVWGKKNEKE